MDAVKEHVVTVLSSLSEVQFLSSEMYELKMICLALLGAWACSHQLYERNEFIGKKSKTHPAFFGTFLLFLVSTFGGGMIIGVLLSKPFFFFYDDRILITWLAIWVIVVYANTVFFHLYHLFIVKLFVHIVGYVFVCEVVMEIGEEVYETFDQRFFPPVIFMFIMGNGGGLLRPVLLTCFTGKPARFPLLKKSMNLGHLVSLLYSIFYTVCGLQGFLESIELDLTVFGKGLKFTLGPKVFCILVCAILGAYDCITESYKMFWSKWLSKKKPAQTNQAQVKGKGQQSQTQKGQGQQKQKGQQQQKPRGQKGRGKKGRGGKGRRGRK